MKELIEDIAKALVDEPGKVRVSEVEGEGTSVTGLSVAKEDLGRQGRTAKALRTILTAASTLVKKRSALEVLE